MRILRLEHVGIATEQDNDECPGLDEILKHPIYKTETVEHEGVETAFIRTGESKVELLRALNEDSPIAKFISKRGAGIHHLAFEVEDLDEAREHIENLGLRIISEKNSKGADNKMIFFVHPRDTGGVLLEFCQSIS